MYYIHIVLYKYGKKLGHVISRTYTPNNVYNMHKILHRYNIPTCKCMCDYGVVVVQCIHNNNNMRCWLVQSIQSSHT